MKKNDKPMIKRDRHMNQIDRQIKWIEKTDDIDRQQMKKIERQITR